MTNTKKSSKWSADDKKAYADAKRAEQAEMLAKAVDALTSEQGWLNYLRTAHTFHNYSFNNRILIAIQRADATQVAGAAKWKKEFNRTIIKGEKAICILAPMIVYCKDPKTKEFLLDGKGNKVIDRIWFKTVPVFDVSQTEGDPLPEPPVAQPLTGESHEEYLYRAEAFAAGMDFTVDYDALLGSDKRGYANLAEKVIAVNGSMAVNAQVRTMIHELAHVVGGIDYAAYTRQQAEVIVESAAFIACGMVGLDTTGMSVPYVTTWGAEAEDPKHALKLMKDFTNVIDTIAEAIVEGIS